MSNQSQVQPSSVTPPGIRLANSQVSSPVIDREQERSAHTVSPVGTGVKFIDTSAGVLKLPVTPVSASWRGPPGGPDWSSGGSGVPSDGNPISSLSSLSSLSANLAKLQVSRKGLHAYVDIITEGTQCTMYYLMKNLSECMIQSSHRFGLY